MVHFLRLEIPITIVYKSTINISCFSHLHWGYDDCAPSLLHTQRSETVEGVEQEGLFGTVP
jgi:hypothetical protein